jgi:hypothetical protein
MFRSLAAALLSSVALLVFGALAPELPRVPFGLATSAQAAVNLNSSRSNIYRQKPIVPKKPEVKKKTPGKP